MKMTIDAFRICCLLCLTGAALHAQTVLYVSPSGHDQQAGTSPKAPLRTLAAALQKSRAMRKSPTDSVTIQLRAGTYPLTRPLVLTPADSRLTIKAYEQEIVTLHGGKRITGRWRQVGPNRWQIAVPDTFTQLFRGTERLTRARFPNTGWWHPKRLNVADRWMVLDGKLPDSFGATTARTTELHATGQWHWIRQRIATFSPTDSLIRTQTYIGPLRSSTKVRPFDRVYLENALEFVDAENEWFLDPKTRILTLQTSNDPNRQPAGGRTPSESAFFYPVLETLIDLDGKKNHPLRKLRLVGIRFQYTSWNLSPVERKGYQAGYWGSDDKDQPTYSPPAALQGRYVEGLVVENCTFGPLGEGAIALEAGSHRNRLLQNTFRDVGSTPIQIARLNNYVSQPHPVVQDYSDPTDAPAHNEIAHNLIRQCGTTDRGCVGILVGYAHHTHLHHNTLDSLPYSGISVGWRWDTLASNSHHNRIEWNRISHCMQYAADGAGIYTVGRQEGSTIHDNWITDIGGAEKLAFGIYNDEGSCYLDIARNYFQRTQDFNTFHHKNLYHTLRLYDNNGVAGPNPLQINNERTRYLALPNATPKQPERYGQQN